MQTYNENNCVKNQKKNMKRILLLLLVLPLLSMKMENDKSKFFGKWVGEDNNEIGYLNFQSDGYAFFEIQGQVFGGKEFIFEGKKGKMTYEVHEETDPVQIDFIITKLESGQQTTLLCIAKFIDDDTMKFAISYDNLRLTEFDTENTIIFKREK